MEQENDTLPDHVINSVMESIKQADEGLLTPYTGIKDMLNTAQPTDNSPK